MKTASVVCDEIVAYYDNASHTAYAEHGAVFAEDYDERVATEGSSLRDLALVIQDLSRGNRVLEVAAGHGRWTRYVARVAEYVLATDASPRMLAQAEELVAHGQDLPDGKVDFLHLDAFEIGRVPGTFNFGFSVNWVEHIPMVRVDEFLTAFHLKLGQGAKALIAINFYRETTREKLYQKSDGPDWYSKRTRPDGSEYEIVDNEYSEEELRELLAGTAKNIEYSSGVGFYWVTYEVV